jgi:hypothetical protein
MAYNLGQDNTNGCPALVYDTGAIKYAHQVVNATTGAVTLEFMDTPPAAENTAEPKKAAAKKAAAKK